MRFTAKLPIVALPLRIFLAMLMVACPYLSLLPATAAPLAAPINSPVEENNEEESSASAKSEIEWIAPVKNDRRASTDRSTPADRPQLTNRSPHRSNSRSCLSTRSDDPYHNGLGTHYRC